MNPISEIINEFKLKRNQIEMSCEEMRTYLEPYDNNILLYGAGSSGIAFYYDLMKIGIKPVFFLDSDKTKVGSTCEGIEIISIDEIQERISGNFIVIVCINTDGRRYCKSFDEALRVGGHHGVYEKLRNAGCRNVIDYTFFRRCFYIFKDEKYNAPSCSDVDLMLEYEADIVSVYDFLGDELSKETYEKIVRFRLLDDSIDVPTWPQDMQYFEDSLYHPRSDAVFVDCGAYNGISARTFFDVQRGEFNHYYGYEPDKSNYKMLKIYAESLCKKMREKITIFNQAVWNKEECIEFYQLCGPGSFITQDIGTNTIMALPIDKLCDRVGKITFIKMNIEGSEKQALSGAKQTIITQKPELAIAGYHRTNDLWVVPQLIREYRPDYRIYLRSYMNHISFVYYAN